MNGDAGETATMAPWTGWGLGTWRLWALNPSGPVAADPRLVPFGWWETAFSEPRVGWWLR